MIQGHFDASGHPKITITVSGGREQIKIEALIDTGFDGEVTIPSVIGVGLGLELIGLEELELADGSVIQSFVFSGQANLGGQNREVRIMLADIDEAIVGTGLLPID